MTAQTTMTIFFMPAKPVPHSMTQTITVHRSNIVQRHGL